jgi:membrane protein, antimicrobial resistance system
MISDPVAAPKSNGLAVLWDVVVAPRAAFEALREHPTAGWAFIVAVLLGMIGTVLQTPAGLHVAEVTFATGAQHDPQLAALTPEQLERAKSFTLGIQHWVWVFWPAVTILAILFTSLIMMIANAAGGGDGGFRRLFALASNIALINFGIAPLIIGLLVVIRGGDSFSTTRDIYGAIPSLAWLVPEGNPKLSAFLASLGPFNLWSLALLALGMQGVAKIKPAAAWITAILISVCAGALGAAFAK